MIDEGGDWSIRYEQVVSAATLLIEWVPTAPDSADKDFGNGAAGRRGPGEPTGAKPVKSKRSTAPGDAQAKMIAVLTKHHRYGEDGCLNQEPIGNNELARLAGVDKATASAFFEQRFKGHGKYKAMCAYDDKLVVGLKLLNGEFAPHFLYWAKRPSEGGREEE